MRKNVEFTKFLGKFLKFIFLYSENKTTLEKENDIKAILKCVCCTEQIVLLVTY